MVRTFSPLRSAGCEDRPLRVVETAAAVVEESQPLDVQLLCEQFEEHLAQLSVGSLEHLLLVLEQIWKIERLELGNERSEDRRGDPAEFDLARLQELRRTRARCPAGSLDTR